MAAHLGRSIRGFVGANKFSIHSNPLSASRPPMGARSCSSMPFSPDQAPRKIKPLGATLLAGIIMTICYRIDFKGCRTADKSLEAAFTSKKLQCAKALLEDAERKIDTIKMKPYERVYKNDNVPQAGNMQALVNGDG